MSSATVTASLVQAAARGVPLWEQGIDPREWEAVLSIVIVMFVVVLVAVGVLVYVAYPHRGQDVPAVPWVGDAMSKGVDALPTIHDNEDAHTRR